METSVVDYFGELQSISNTSSSILVLLGCVVVFGLFYLIINAFT